MVRCWTILPLTIYCVKGLPLDLGSQEILSPTSLSQLKASRQGSEQVSKHGSAQEREMDWTKAIQSEQYKRVQKGSWGTSLKALVVLVLFVAVVERPWQWQFHKEARQVLEAKDLPSNPTYQPSLLELAFNLPPKPYPWYSVAWAVGRVFLVVLLLAAAFLLRPPEETRQWWPGVFLGIFGPLLPSAGIPIGGGLVFVPVLVHFCNFNPALAVALSNGVQSLGLAIVTPVTWLQKEGFGVIYWRVVPFCLFFGMIGVYMGFYVFNLGQRIILTAFTMGMTGLAFFCLRSSERTVLHKEEQTPFGNTWHGRSDSEFGALLFAAWGGGFLTANLATGADKFIFWALAGFSGGSIFKSTLTGVALNGWLSWMAFACIVVRGDVIPWTLISMMLPGTIVGAMVGPIVLRFAGQRCLLLVASCILLFEASKNVSSLWDCSSDYSLWHAPKMLPGTACP